MATTGKYLLLFIFLSFFSNQLHSKQNDQLMPLKVLIARIDIGKEMNGYTPSKVQAAFALTMLMGKFFDIVPPKTVDTLIAQFNREGKSSSIYDVANYFKVNFITFIDVNRFQNIIRTDITLLSGKDYSNDNKGTGYSFVNYRDGVDTNLIYDPSLLTSIQRAFAVAIKDSNMFSGLKQPVHPAKTSVISGIQFINEESLPRWDIFTNEVTDSYFMLESIFESASQSDRYVIFDFATRDSIYANFNFYTPENYKAPNQMELYALRKFEVNTFITGTFKRIPEGAELTLVHKEFTNEGFQEINRVTGILKNDSKVELEKFVKNLTLQLFEIELKE